MKNGFYGGVGGSGGGEDGGGIAGAGARTSTGVGTGVGTLPSLLKKIHLFSDPPGNAIRQKYEKLLIKCSYFYLNI